jgi:lambda family phage tail tape measure protein
MRQNAQQRFGDNAGPLIAQINRWEKMNTTISGTTVNAKQLQQAIRFLPAQFTDIGVSLAGGMNPLLVLLQQGGQIMDQFRLSGAGVGDTFRAIGGAALRLVNPVTVALAAIAGIGFASYSAAKELDAFTVAAIRTGEISGTAQQLKDYANTLDQIEGISSGLAIEATQKVAASGLLIGDNFKLASEAAVRWSSVTGDSIESVTKKFEEIAKDPLVALERLNASEHFLTQTQRERVQVLIEQGDQQGAVNEALRIYFDMYSSRSAQVEQSLSNWSMFMRDLKDATSGAWQSFKEYADGVVGRARELAESNKLWATSFWGASAITADALFNPKKPVAIPLKLDFRGDEALSQTETKAIGAVEAALKGARSESEKFDAAVKDLKNNLRNLPTAELKKLGISRDGDQFSGAAYDKLIESLRPKPKKSRGGTSARGAAREVRAEFDMQLAMLRTQTKEVEAAYSLRELSAVQYYEKLMQLAKQERDIQIASNNAQMQAAAGKKGNEQEIARLRAANVQAEEQYKQRDIELTTRQKQITQQYADQYKQLVWGLQDGTLAMKQQMELQIAGASMGDRELTRLQARLDIERERDRQLRELDRKVELNADYTEQAEKDKAAIIEETNKKLAMQADLYGQLDATVGDWKTGATKAWQEWLEEVGDVSGKAYQVFNATFDGLASNITDVLTGSAASWKDYFNNLHKMITRFIVEQKLTEWMQGLNGGGSGGGGIMGFVGNLFGALMGGGGGNPNTVSYAPGGSFTWNPAVRPFANGGAPGAAGLAAYRNTVVSSPTLFPFAKGGVPNYGLMGERSGKPHEAIVPLTRTSGGDLGVKMVGSGERGNLTVNQTFVVQGTPDRMTRGQMMRAAGAETSRAIRRG